MRIQRMMSIEFYLALLLTITVVGLIFPYGFPLFTLVGILYFFIFLITKKISIYINLGLISFYLLILFFLGGILSTESGLNSLIISSIASFVVLLITLLIFGNGTENTIIQTKAIFFTSLTIITPFLGIFSIYKYILLLRGNRIDFLIIEGRQYPWGTSLMPDYNMFALGMLICLIAIVYSIRKSTSIIFSYYCALGLLLAFSSIILSGSRRGIILLVILLLYFLIYFLYIFFKTNLIRKIITITSLLLFAIVGIQLIVKAEIQIVNPYEIEKIKYRYSTINQFESSFSQRTERWIYAEELLGSYSPLELLLGSGFDYHQDFGKKFNVETGLDYPHNLFISTFLYSGVVGVLVLIFIIFAPFIRGIKQGTIFKEELLVVYVLCLIFFFVSADSLFTINILWLISSLLICAKSRKDSDII